MGAAGIQAMPNAARRLANPPVRTIRDRNLPDDRWLLRLNLKPVIQ